MNFFSSYKRGHLTGSTFIFSDSWFQSAVLAGRAGPVSAIKPTLLGAADVAPQVIILSQLECSGSVVACLTRDQGAAGSSLTGVIALCP